MSARPANLKIELPGDGDRIQISFGSATLRAPRATEEQGARGVEESRRAMKGLAEALLALPGTELERVPGVPRFYADRQNPKMIIRDLDGIIQRGVFVDGRFEEVRGL